MMYYLMFSLVFVQSDLLFLCCYQLFITGQKLWITALVFIVFSLILPSLWLSPTCRLLAKLEAHGIKGNMLQWFRYFLTAHQQRVVINGHHSDWQHAFSGVLLGSILGPLLFIIYINDISSFTNTKLKIFADDVTLFSSIKYSNDCLSLQADLDAISRWCRLWQMKINPSKCEVLCISTKRLLPKFDYNINGSPLKWHSLVRYLGVHINSKLSWNDHRSAIAAEATRVLNILRRNLSGCCISTKSRAFRILVIPILEYAAQVWNPYTKKNIDKPKDIQLHGACWVCGSRYKRTTFSWSKPSVQWQS